MFRNFTIAFLFFLGASTIALGQIRTPAASPSAKFEQAVGLTNITVEYSRPGVKGRTIFGDLVPFDKVWRTGANQATKITFSDDVTVEGKALSAGSYAILTKPGKMSWDVHFYKHESGNWSSYVEKTPDAVVTVKPIEVPAITVENFFITFANLKSDGALLELIWNHTIVPINIGVETHSKVMAAIDKTLAGPTVGDYYNAGAYLHDSGQDLEKALMYVQKATSGDSPRFWQVRKESLILADLGRKAEAIAAAKKSLKLATAAGNDDYVKMNTDSIKKWSM